jgi:hypothetical protein
VFYNKSIELIFYNEGTIDDSGIYSKGVEFTTKQIDCDVQPYSKERLYRDYGFDESVKYRVFCDPNEDLKVGKTVKYDNSDIVYKVVRIILWDDYWEVMIDG